MYERQPQPLMQYSQKKKNSKKKTIKKQKVLDLLTKSHIKTHMYIVVKVRNTREASYF